jgi:hypothetical protein
MGILRLEWEEKGINMQGHEEIFRERMTIMESDIYSMKKPGYILLEEISRLKLNVKHFMKSMGYIRKR